MPSERAFLRQRLALVERWLTDPNREFIYAGKGRVRFRTHPWSERDVTKEREARLLRKLLARAREGQVLTTLKVWRRHLGQFLVEHRQPSVVSRPRSAVGARDTARTRQGGHTL